MLMFGSMLVFRETLRAWARWLGVLVLLPGFVLIFKPAAGLRLFTQMTSYTVGIRDTLAAAFTCGSVWAGAEAALGTNLVRRSR